MLRPELLGAALLIEWRGFKIDVLNRTLLSRSGVYIDLLPREWLLLIRLIQSYPEPVSRMDLLRDVFNLNFEPETNTLTVTVSRLRPKIYHHGLMVMRTEPKFGEAQGYELVDDS